MDLGAYSSYRLPPSIAGAFGVTTAQELADQVGATGTLTPDVVHEAERAYEAWRTGDRAPARALLVGSAGLDGDAADAVLERVAQQS
ncbi:MULTISPECIES: hypothetical protein [unclassified Agrococcus]|uniref:hypothetical protein n=1 Tax=unclassified Agrococcus TaxID=2615065 RepID=UPI00361316B7